ncbi:hypothetical protein D3C78_939480 [compost metagenome]
MLDEGLGNCRAHRHARIERRERVLKDHLHRFAHVAQADVIEAHHIVTVEGHIAGRRLHEAHDRAAGGGFSATGFTHQRQRFSLKQIEGHVLDAVNRTRLARQQAGADGKTRHKVLDRQNRCLSACNRLGHLLRLGRKAGFHVENRKTRRPLPVTHRTELRHRRKQRPRIGMFAAPEYVLRRPGLDFIAAIHHDRAVSDFGHHTHVMGDEEHRHALLLLQQLDEIEDLALNGNVERRRGLVGDQQFRPRGERHGNHHPLTHAARKLMRIFVKTTGGVGNADLLQKPHRLRPRLLLRKPLVADEDFGNLTADGEDRIERGHRLLKDHRDIVAAHATHLFFGKRQQIAPVEQDFPFYPAGGWGKQAHQ